MRRRIRRRVPFCGYETMNESVYIGLDVGGTNIKASAVSPSGEITARVHRPSPEGGDEAIRRTLGDLMESAADGRRIEGIGVGCAGVLAPDRRSIRTSPNLLSFEGFPLCDTLEETFGVAALLENDANAIALGEHWRGAGKGAETLVAITLGTGIGTGCILRGSLWRGGDGSGAEGGHITIDLNGPPCRCGNHGCLEAFVGTYGILRRLGEKLAEGGHSGRLAVDPDPTVEDIAEAAQDGDPLAVEVMRETGFFLGVGMANFANLFNPDMIILTGGVSRAGDILLGPAEAEMKRRAFAANTESLKVVTGRLGDDAGPLGAVYPLVAESR